MRATTHRRGPTVGVISNLSLRYREKDWVQFKKQKCSGYRGGEQGVATMSLNLANTFAAGDGGEKSRTILFFIHK